MNIHLGDCLDVMENMANKGIIVDAIITDPPCLYLDHKLDSGFDEERFFELASKVIKKDGALVYFGRGESYFRWGCIASKYFKFKEEVIWNKKSATSPFLPLGRIHENIAIFGRGKFKIRKVLIDHIESKLNNDDIVGLVNDIKRIVSSIKNIKKVDDFIKWGEYKKDLYAKIGHKITCGERKNKDRGYQAYNAIANGCIMKSIYLCNREHYQYEHPTQKPIDLMEKLISLVTDEGDVVLDPFAGGGSTGVACKNIGRDFILIEKLKEYYDIALKRTG